MSRHAGGRCGWPHAHGSRFPDPRLLMPTVGPPLPHPALGATAGFCVCTSIYVGKRQAPLCPLTWVARDRPSRRKVTGLVSTSPSSPGHSGNFQRGGGRSGHGPLSQISQTMPPSAPASHVALRLHWACAPISGAGWYRSLGHVAWIRGTCHMGTVPALFSPGCLPGPILLPSASAQKTPHPVPLALSSSNSLAPPATSQQCQLLGLAQCTAWPQVCAGQSHVRSIFIAGQMN